MKPFKIGTYQLGYRMVDLWGNPDKCGALFNLCKSQKPAMIETGLKYQDPSEAFGVLCHEVWEMVMQDMGCALTPLAFMPQASDTGMFVFNHNQHTEISARASYFLWQCFDDFKKAHAKCHPQPEKKE
jgi:hypothetical protein